jgi:hypothetical protein
MDKRIPLVVIVSIIVGIFLIKYIPTLASPAKPNPGHSWSELECDSNLCVDTTNSRIGIGNPTPGYKLDVNGDVNIGGTNVFRRGGIAGASTTCGSGQTPSGLTISGGIITSAGSCTAIDVTKARSWKSSTTLYTLGSPGSPCTGFTEITGVTTTVTTGNNPVLFIATVNGITVNDATGYEQLQLEIDGTAKYAQLEFFTQVRDVKSSAFSYMETLTAASHTIKLTFQACWAKTQVSNQSQPVTLAVIEL